jgi:hypothetical protein
MFSLIAWQNWSIQMKPAKKQQIGQYKAMEHNIMDLTTPQNQDLLVR